MKTEHRKNKRFSISEDNFILFHDGNVGRMRNISLEGCSCTCLVTENILNKPTSLSILYNDNGGMLMLEKVPFTIVHSCFNNSVPFTTTKMKKCGVKFGDISSTQKKQIKSLIAQYGVL